MEDITLAPGRYVLAVSGGVDSMVLLNLLQNRSDLKLIVAHFDHGIRGDSHYDQQLVAEAAKFYGLPYVYNQGALGPRASEAEARQARYRFLRQVRSASSARAIVTAHHQDDLLETVLLNLLRGTGRKGLSPLASHHDVIRPLLNISKKDILDYALERDLIWHEDSTNQDTAYLRNYLRRQIMPNMSNDVRLKLLEVVNSARITNASIDDLIHSELHLQSKGGQLDRDWFNHLPHKVALEVMAGWLRAHGSRDFDKRTLDRLVIAAKAGRSGSLFDIYNGLSLKLTNTGLALQGAER